MASRALERRADDSAVVMIPCRPSTVEHEESDARLQRVDEELDAAATRQAVGPASAIRSGDDHSFEWQEQHAVENASTLSVVLGGEVNALPPLRQKRSDLA